MKIEEKRVKSILHSYIIYNLDETVRIDPDLVKAQILALFEEERQGAVKQERERIIEMLGHCRETRRGYIGSYVVWTRAVEEVWQALKGTTATPGMVE